MSQGQDTSFLLRTPVRTDGAAIHSLIQSCPPLDVNSLYVYLLLAEHFSATCVVAEDAEGQIDGFVSAYVPPGRDDVLFVWQVAVHERARGKRLARRMLTELLSRPALSGIRFIETTVGPDNAASRKTFSGLATGADTSITESSLFDASLFGGAAHEDERLLRIGPIAR